MTTAWINYEIYYTIYLFGLLYITNGLAYGCNIFCLIVRDLYIKFFFKFHNQLHGVQGIGTEVIGKASFGYNFILIYPQFIYNDCLYS